MTRPILAALASAVALAAAPAAAQFEGRLDYEMKGKALEKEKEQRGGGKAVVWLGPGGARTEMTMNLKEGPYQNATFVTLWKRSEPKRVYFMNDAKKVYAVWDVEEKHEGEAPRLKIERLGSSRVAGYSCERARISSKEDSSQEICVTAELGKVPVHLATDQRGLDIWNELRKAGLDGVPVSWASGGSEGESFSMVLVSAKRQKVPAGLLSVPASYQKTSMVGAFATPEQEKQMEAAMKQMQEQMKNMSPEQRKQVEEMMKQYGTGKK